MSWGREHEAEFNFKERASFSYDGNMTFSMTIRNVRKEDRGEFFCRADNRLISGRVDTKKAVLKVNCKRKIEFFSSYNFIPQSRSISFQLNLRSETSRVFPNLLKT